MNPATTAGRSTAGPRDQQSVLPTGVFGRTSRLLALPVRHAARTVAAASRLSSATTEQIATRSAEQVFATLGELKGGATKLGQAMSVFEAALPDNTAGPYRSTLSRLVDATPAMPAAVALRVLESDLSAAYGCDWPRRLVDFDETRPRQHRSGKYTAGDGATIEARSSTWRSRCSTPASPKRCTPICELPGYSAGSWLGPPAWTSPG